MTDEQKNKAIHEWFGKCWHDFQNDCVCQKSGCCADNSFRNENPAYHTESGFFALLDGARTKGYVIDLTAGVLGSDNSTARALLTKFHDYPQPDEHYAQTTDTLPLALREAALKAMEAETK